MTGRDVPTRQKTLSVAFSVIMVLSMVAVGMAGFAGSAAAASQSTQLSEGEATIFADSANAGADSTHTAAIKIDSSSIAGNDLNNVTINYQSDVTVSGVDGGTTDLSNNPDIRIFVNGNNVTASSTSITTSDDDDRITVDSLSTSETLNQGDRVTIEVKGIVNPSGDVDAVVSVEDGQTPPNTLTAPATTLTIGDGPIEVNPGSTTNTIFFNSLDEALANVSGSSNAITVTEDLNETSLASKPEQNSRTLATGDVTISGTSNPTINVSQAAAIDLNGADNVTVDGITFNASARGSATGTAIVASGTTSTELTIQNSIFRHFTSGNGPVLDLNTGVAGDLTNLTIDDPERSGATGIQASTAGDLNITDSTLNNVTGQTGIDVTGMGAHVLDVSSNTIDLRSGGTGVSVDASADMANATIDSNIINGAGSGSTDTAISLDASSSAASEVDIIGGTINGTKTGITTTGGHFGDFLNITDADITNLTNTPTGISVDTDGNGNEALNIDGVTLTRTAPGVDTTTGTAISLSDTGTNLDPDIVDATISDYNNGIVVDGTTSVATIRGGTIQNINSIGIDINSPGDVVVNESTSISNSDQTATGVDIANNGANTIDVTGIDINGTSNGVEISDVGNNDAAVNVTSNTFTENVDGVIFTDGGNDGGGALYNVHFNTFESNTDGVEVSADKNDNAIYNATFNDFVSNDENGLHVSTTQGSTVNANYSWWDNRDYSRIVGPYTPQNAGSQLSSPRRVYSYTRLHTGGQP